jgi:hypothetical protein
MFDVTDHQKQLLQILDLIEDDVANGRLRVAQSSAILQAIKVTLNLG